jgi:LysR family positive regulator for ilvC
LNNPLIYATVSGHEAIVSMVALGCGVALIPVVVLENSPDLIRNRIAVHDNVTIGAPLPLGVCVQRKRLNEPLIEAFWQSLLQVELKL